MRIVIIMMLFGMSGVGGFMMRSGRCGAGVRLFAKKIRIGGGVGGGGVAIGGGHWAVVTKGRDVIIYTENQHKYLDALRDPTVAIIVVVGAAGTGKTFIGCRNGLSGLLAGHYKRFVITRPLVPVSGEELGFLPGGVTSKMEPWTRPIYDAFLEDINKKELDGLIGGGEIDIIPLAYMRGRTFSNSFIFADEMQNSTPEQMLMLLTRIGMGGSKLVISGDLAQTDIGGSGRVNGLRDFVERLRLSGEGVAGGEEGDGYDIRLVEFDNGDIRRSPIIKKILDIYSA